VLKARRRNFLAEGGINAAFSLPKMLVSGQMFGHLACETARTLESCACCNAAIQFI
jgi:hypothetical protein